MVFPTGNEFSEDFGYDLASQEESIRKANEFAWTVRGEALTLRQRRAVGYMYTVGAGDFACDSASTSAQCKVAGRQCSWNGTSCDTLPGRGTLSFNSGFARQRPELLGNGYSPNMGAFGTDIAQAELYRNVILRNCDTCHMAMDGTDGGGVLTHNALASWTALTGAAVLRSDRFQRG